MSVLPSFFLRQPALPADRLAPTTVPAQRLAWVFALGIFSLGLSLTSAIAADTPDAKPKAKPPTEAAIAARKADAARYATCMNTIDRNARDAFDMADSWVALGGGEPARHCAAAALLKLGFATEAAERLQKLAETSPQDDVIRAQMFDQAGQAWAQAKNWDHANTMQSMALQLAPNQPALWISRGRLRAQAQNYGLAVDDLTEALKRNPKSHEALILRGSAYRYLDALDLALEDLNAALALAPNDPEARMERGIIFRLRQEPNRARADWAVALQNLDEADPMVEDVRRNIELLEFPAPATETTKP